MCNHAELDAWLDFQRGERVSHTRHNCTECKQPIPQEDDLIEWDDGSGFLCEACAAADGSLVSHYCDGCGLHLDSCDC